MASKQNKKINEYDIFTRNRASQASKQDKTSPAAPGEEASMADLAVVLTELKSLSTQFGGFGNKLDSIDKRMGEMAGFITVLETNMLEVKREVADNSKRMGEAETRIMTAEEDLNKAQAELSSAVKRIAYLETKADDLENRSRRKNLRLFGLREGAEGNQPLLGYIQNMLPRWLERGNADEPFILERAHRTLAPPKPNQHRAVLIRFLKFQDRELVFRSTKQRAITHEGNRLSFAQDLSAETMRQRREFDTAKRVFIEKGTFRGFQINPCKMRILHNGKLRVFSTPREAEDFHRGARSTTPPREAEDFHRGARSTTPEGGGNEPSTG